MRVDNTRSIRAARVRAKKLAAGMASRTVYLPTATLESLGRTFPGPAGGIEWQEVARAALVVAHKRAMDAERQRKRREAGLVNDTTTNERARKYREANREAVNQRQRKRRAGIKAAKLLGVNPET